MTDTTMPSRASEGDARPLLEMRNITKRFGGVVALDQASKFVAMAVLAGKSPVLARGVAVGHAGEYIGTFIEGRERVTTSRFQCRLT